MNQNKAEAALSTLVNFPDYAIFIGISLLLLVTSAAIFSLLTPYNELKLIKNGNVGAGVAYAGNILGIALVINSISYSTHDPLELLIWSTVGLVIQLAAFYALTLVLPDIFKRISDENSCVAHGAMVAGVSVSVALLNSGALSA